MSDIADDQHDIEELVVGHFDGTLTEAQEEALTAELAASDSARQLFLSYMRMEGRLHSLGRDGFLREPTTEAQDTVPEPADSTPAVHVPRRSWRSRIWTASTSLAVCAAVMLTWTLWPSSVSASSVLERAQQATAEMVDRTYRLVLSNANASGGPASRELRVTVRGGGRFVVQPDNGVFVLGSDGTDFWIARRNGPIFVADDLRTLASELRGRIPNRRQLGGVLASPDEPLLLDMSSLLKLIKSRYDIELVASADPGEHHVRATRRSNFRGGPSIINLQADADSGVVLNAEVTFDGSRQRTWELIETSNLSDQWYQHSEHAPHSPVVRLDAAE